MIEAILVAILVGLLASIGIIKAADAKLTTAENVLNSAIQDVNMLVQRHVVDGYEINISTPQSTTMDGLAFTYERWDAVLDSSVLNGYITTESADSLKALTGSSGEAAGKIAGLPVTVQTTVSTTAKTLEFFPG